MAESYKARKEAFVSNLSGSSVWDIHTVSAVVPSAVLLWSVLQSRRSLFTPYELPAVIADFLLTVVTVLFAVTAYSSSPIVLNILLLSPAALLLLSTKPKNVRQKAKPPPGSTKSTAHQGQGSSDAALDALPQRPFLTHYRASLMISTCLSILAVDFTVFPRRFAKVENWGTSLMDLGVGSFVFSGGVVSARSILGRGSAASRGSFAKRLLASARHSIPLLVLGLIRLYSVKGLDYAEHVTEYGVHWNFFFTLGLLPPFVEIFHAMTALIPWYEALSLLVIGAYQVALESTSLKEYILVSPRGPSLLSKNREGVFSFLGYLAIFLSGRAAGLRIIPRKPRRTLLIQLVSWSAVWATLFILNSSYFFGYGAGIPVSRRLANMPYVFWVNAFNMTHMLLYCLIETVVFPSVEKASNKKEEAEQSEYATSRVMRSFNKNGLAIFLIANLLTGAVNLGMNTLDARKELAMAVLMLYSVILTASALALDFWNGHRGITDDNSDIDIDRLAKTCSVDFRPALKNRRRGINWLKMAANKNPYRTFPRPVEGPNVPYKAAQESNPILRGRMLEIAAALVQYSSFIQSILWRNAGFSTIRDIQHLTAYEPKFDPTVLPPLTQQSGTETPELPAPTRRRQDGKGDYYTSADYRELYKTGKLTPTAVVEALLPVIRRDTSPPGEFSAGFSQSKIDLVRASAEASTQRWANGTPLGPMDGIPVAIKDEVDIDGYDKYLSSKVNFTANPSFTSWCVKKWEEAGAIVIGKTVMHEIGLDTTNNNPVVGTPRNPHNPGYYTGGSSGGSGYAVGAGVVPLALGADGGGSIRIPSNYCGIYGLKTTHGRVSAAPTCRLATTVGVFGPMASSIDDLAMGYRIMSAPDPNNPVPAAFPDPLLSIPSPSSSRGKVIGVYKDWVERSNPDVLAMFNKAIDYYRDEQGYQIVDITIPYIPEGGKCHALSILNEISSGLTKEQISQLSAPTRIVVSVGGTQGLAQDYFASQRMRHLLMNHLSFLFQKYPGIVIATPTTPTAGSKISGGEADLTNGISDSNATLQSMEYVYLANFTGCPAISCPMGYDDEPSVPVGLMGMGEWGSEEALMEWARDGEGMLGDKGLRAPNKEKGGKWLDAINLALNPSTD